LLYSRRDMKVFLKPALGIILLLALVLSGYFVFLLTTPAKAAVITWDGGGATNNWSEDANWSGDIEPGTADVATFDGTSTKNVTIDTTISVAGIDVNSGYTGTMTQASGAAITIGTSDFDMSAGIFTGGDSAITCGANCSFTISGGAFTSTTGTLSLATSFTISSGSFEPSTGTVTATGTATGTWDFVSSETFYNLTIAKSSGIIMQIASGDTAIVTNTVTLTDGFYGGSGVIDARGSITQAATFDGGGGILDFGDNSVAQTYTSSGGTGPHLRLNHASDANDSVIINAAAGFDTFEITSGFSGTIPLNNASNFTLTFDAWTQAAGTYDASSQSAWNVLDVNISGGTFTAPTLVTATGSSTTWDLNTTQTFNQFTINKTHTTAMTIPAEDNLVVTGLLTLTNGGFSTGTINAQGNISQTSGYDGGTGTLNFANDAAVQTYTVNGGETPFITFDDPDDANDDIDVTAASSFQGFVVTSGFSGAIPLNNPSDFTLTFAYLEMAAGTWDASAQSSWSVGDFEITGGTLTPAATVTTTGSGLTWNVNTTQTFNNLNINRSNGANLVITSGDTVLTTGTLTLTNGNVDTGSLEAQGDVSVVSSFDGGTANLKFSGSATQSFTLTGATALFDGDIQVNKSGGQVNLTTALTLDASSQDLVIQEGKFNLNGQTLIINGTSGVFTVEDGGNFQLQGGETLTLNASQPTLSTGSTVTYVGNGNAGANTYTITALKSTYHHLVVNSTDGATDTFQLGAALDVNGNLTISAGTFDVSSSNHAITLAGNWTNAGTFSAQAGSVTLDASTNHTLSGATTWHNLTLLENTDNAANTTLTLGSAQTQTIGGTLTLDGLDASDKLVVVASTGGSAATFNFTGSSTFSGDFLTITDNTATDNSSGVTLPLNPASSANGGNTVGWFTASGVTVSAISGNTTEASGAATFTVVLDALPSDNVEVDAVSADSTEGTVTGGGTLTFTTGNWNVPQTVTVTGVNDDIDDGDTAYSITISTDDTNTLDNNYDAVDPADVAVINTDNDTAGITVSAISGNTTEAGGTAAFTVVLLTEPTGNVEVDSVTNDATEGTVSGNATLTFTALNWSTPQTVTVTGADDSTDDGDIVYSIQTATDDTNTLDNTYDAIDPADVTVTNTDDDTSGGGQTVVTPTPEPVTWSVTVTAPAAGEELVPGSYREVTWQSSPEDYYVNISASYDGGVTFTSLAENVLNDGSWDWLVPDIDAAQAMLKVTVTDLATDLASDFSEAFVILGTEEEVIDEELPEAEVPVDEVTDEDPLPDSPNPTQDVDIVSPNSYIRSQTSPQVYFVDNDFTRHPILHQLIYFTYHSGWEPVQFISDTVVALLNLDGLVLPKPGVVLVKLVEDPRVYAVFAGADGSTELRWIASESLAAQLYGSDWADYVIDIDPTLWSRFTFGPNITEVIPVDRSIMKKRVNLHE
jgi:hypothetical protein